MYSGVQAGNIAVLAGALILVLNYFGFSLGDGEAQTLVGAAAILLGPVASYITEFRRGATTVVGTFKSPVE